MKLKLSFGLLLLLICGAAAYYSKITPVLSVQPSSVRDSLSSSQLSYYAILATGNTAGNSVILIGSSGPSKTSNNLFAGDTMSIGLTSALHTYTIKDIGNTATFQINTGISAADVAASAVAIVTRSAIHYVSFAPNSSYTAGKWEVLIKVSTSAPENYNDGLPDQFGFDLGGGGNAVVGTDVSCPFTGVASVGGTVALTTTDVSVGFTGTYQSFQCTTPTGNSVGTGATGIITIGGAHKLINPAPNHAAAAEGNADLSTFVLRHYDGGGNVVTTDTDVGRIAVNEAVRVTATVDPTLTFTIDNAGIGTTGCGVPLLTNQSSVTATAVPFGSLAIGQTTNTLAQRLGVVTNGAGYVVTAYEGHTMNDLDGSGITIPDTNCDSNTCNSSGIGSSWTTSDANQSEFGYSLQALSAGPTLAITTASAGSFIARPFGNGSANAQTIFYYNLTPLAIHYVATCYRVTATTVQKAGDYENQIVYTATATF